MEKSFDITWKESKEALYTHWIRSEPCNQIQFAFRQHWLVLKSLIDTDTLFNGGKRCMEVGCGRGTISAYFSDAGYDCTLLDISHSAIDAAKKIFKANDLKATFTIGDTYSLLYPDRSFDIVFSFGLLEHLQDVESAIKEQLRVLDSGGLFLAYVVPKYVYNVQDEYEWINNILRGYKTVEPKSSIYRTSMDSSYYCQYLKELQGVKTSGIYPVPMISHCPEFPFTLMPEESEKALVVHLNKMLSKTAWLCKEGYGQAFIIWGYK